MNFKKVVKIPMKIYFLKYVLNKPDVKFEKKKLSSVSDTKMETTAWIRKHN